MYTTLIESAELAAPLTHAAAQWALVDCRFDLARPEWGQGAYAAGHVPSALYAHLDQDLSGPISPLTGRHPLPNPDRLAETFGRWGIDAEVQVVAYDQGNGAYASRLWWLLRWAGHKKVAVLNGGFAAWQQAGLPVEATVTQRQPRKFIFRGGLEQVVSTAELERAVRDGTVASGAAMLVDARAADRFAGEHETIDPVAGHIPGARNHPFARNLDANGRFLPASQLRERWTTTLGASAARPGAVIAMCGSGVTACHNLLALEVAGLGGAQLYAGSWSEWIRSPEHPVATGAT
jgi:thiosulfate/3-mercaptopyruvate sulfurtransferase